MSNAWPAITVGSFEGHVAPPEVANQILNLLLGGAPFAGALTRYPTQRSSVVFPTARPDAPAWTPEMGDLPIVGLGDAASVVAVSKLGSIVLMSNESTMDADIDLMAGVGNLLRDSASAELDHGLLYGEGPPEPAGAVASAPTATGPDLAGALTAAIGSIGDAGGTATHFCARPSRLANARNERDAGGVPLWPAGIGAFAGLTEVPVPQLEAGDALVLDASRVFLIVRNDFTVDISNDFAFRQDAAALRIRGRFAAACPQVDKGIRRLVIGEENGEGNGNGTTNGTTNGG